MSFVLENKTIVVAVGTTSAELIPARTTREHLFLQNNGANNIFIRFGEAVAAITGETSIKLVSGATLLVETPGVSAIQAIAAVATTNLTISETLLKVPAPSEPILFMPLLTDLAVIKGNGPATFTRSTTGTFLDVQSGLVKTAAIDTPRFEANGVLIEGASTNNFLRSEEFNAAAWIKAGVSVSANVAIAPDGNPTADQLIFTDANSTCNQDVTTTTSASEERTATFYIKDISGSGFIRIEFEDNISGVQTSADLAISTTEFTRIDFTATFGAASISREIRLRGNSVGTTGTIVAWGAQQELLSFATSYIPTVSTSVTRGTESLNINSLGNFRNDVGTISFEAELIGVQSSVDQRFFAASDGTNDNVHLVRKVSSSNITSYFMSNATVTQASISGGSAWAAGDQRKIVATFGINQAELFSDSASLGTDASVSPPVITTLNIGTGVSGSNPIFGHIKTLQVFAKVLTLSRIKRL